MGILMFTLKYAISPCFLCVLYRIIYALEYTHQVLRLLCKKLLPILEFQIRTNKNISNSPAEYFSVVIERHQPTGGLGLKLQKGPLPGSLQVHALLDLDTNPSSAAGVRPNDLVLGINGSSFAQYTLQQAVQARHG